MNTAIYDAASAGSGWGFGALRRTLHTARLQRRSPWAALTELADQIGSRELRELASSVELAGTSGARVRDSLRAKAISVRDHELAESEAEALAASERMGGPMVGMFVGLILYEYDTCGQSFHERLWLGAVVHVHAEHIARRRPQGHRAGIRPR